MMAATALGTTTFTVRFTLTEPASYSLTGFGSEFSLVNNLLIYGSLVDHVQTEAHGSTRNVPTDSLFKRAASVAQSFRVLRVGYNSSPEILIGLAAGSGAITLGVAAAYQILDLWNHSARTRADVAEENTRRVAAEYIASQIEGLKKRPDVARKSVKGYDHLARSRQLNRPVDKPSPAKRIREIEADATRAITRLEDFEIEDNRS